MATNKAPKHDFAPAWLKIPDQDGKSSGSKQNDYDRAVARNSRKDDYYNGYNYPHCHDYPYHGGHPLQRQRSFDYYEDRRYPPQKFRHHSVDDDYYSPYGGYPHYYNGYNYEKYSSHYRSQPQLYREGKYQHPNARYSQVAGMYPPPPPPPYPYDPYYDYYGGEYYPPPPGYMRGPGCPPGPPMGKRFPNDKDARFGRSGDRDGRSSDSNGPTSRKASLEDDFPSLNGDSTPHDKEKAMSRGVWDSQSKDMSRPGYKVMTVNKNKGKEDTTKKQQQRTSENINNNGPSKEASPVQIPISNSPADTTSLKDGMLSKNNNKHEDEVDKVVNGIDDIHVSPVEEKLLSSSLEAEQRLLREMGWNEADEEEYEITEDDMKEFYNLSKQMKEKKNGLTRTLPKTWSPQHIGAPYQPSQAGLNETSSDDSESDMD